MTDFDPAQHRMVSEQRWFEDFVLGERFVIPSRTQTSAVFAAFQTASGDTHPIHYDVEFCRARGMPDLLAHGFQIVIQTANLAARDRLKAELVAFGERALVGTGDSGRADTASNVKAHYAQHLDEKFARSQRPAPQPAGGKTAKARTAGSV